MTNQAHASQSPSKLFLLLAAGNGFLAVVLGAFAAHGLENLLTPARLETFRTGVEYHLVHTLALFGTALLQRPGVASRLVNFGGWLFMLGILLFSGSLYLLSLSGIGWLGAITPLGGGCFLAGWLMLFCHAWRLPSATGGTGESE